MFLVKFCRNSVCCHDLQSLNSVIQVKKAPTKKAGKKASAEKSAAPKKSAKAMKSTKAKKSGNAKKVTKMTSK